MRPWFRQVVAYFFSVFLLAASGFPALLSLAGISAALRRVPGAAGGGSIGSIVSILLVRI